ncbi:gene transfer agent family protein [Bradyrhizobium sp. NP1]|uniref:gene transfer agent family protein n=1 Tax=Bradyrhizobium sp. NP1 TaxID=3049772 RepID=UPI0025A5FD0C|nr:gene transfer agent family protein [Bradyrhizobium sp. NP1]WJR76004.1 gene transfer agent family protein [Bradyrhizobium sp. NP1]
MKPFSAFFGDAEYQFMLTFALAGELEQKCGAGIGTICARVFAKHFAQSDITETIRLALIGGGMAPKRAAELVALYATDRPLSESYPLVAKILERRWFGNPHETTNGQA